MTDNPTASVDLHLPWRNPELFAGPADIVDNNGKMILWCNLRESTGEDVARAEYIVRAANAFEPMRDALRSAMVIVETVGKPDGCGPIVAKAIDDRVAKIRAALTLAETAP